MKVKVKKITKAEKDYQDTMKMYEWFYNQERIDIDNAIATLKRVKLEQDKFNEKYSDI